MSSEQILDSPPFLASYEVNFVGRRSGYDVHVFISLLSGVISCSAY